MPSRSLHLVAYDIADQRRLARALHAVRAYASGGQKSVHECWLSGAEHAVLIGQLRRQLLPGQDRLLSVRVDPRSQPHVLGVARVPVPPGLFVIA